MTGCGCRLKLLRASVEKPRGGEVDASLWIRLRCYGGSVPDHSRTPEGSFQWLQPVPVAAGAVSYGSD